MDQPEWIDSERYPFESRELELSDLRIHYLDEGVGRPVVLLHGNPTWSFLYRHIIRDLREDRRCIAPDWPGFGLSGKPADFDYAPSSHARILRSLIERLDVENLDLVVHDWGGPIGLDVVRRMPERVGRLVVFNSWIGTVHEWFRPRWFSRIVGSWLGWLGTEMINGFPYLMYPAIRDRKRFRRTVWNHYTEPLRDGSRKGPRRFARALASESDWLSQIERDVQKNLAEVPLLVLWGDRDPVLPDGLIDRWTDVFSDHEVRRFDDASHFVPEDLAERAVEPIERFLDRS